jgi:uncharacterized protein YjbI with pentapeptide repeats
MSGDETDLDRLIAELRDGKRLEGLDLSGKDLSYQSLAGVDLRGALLRKTAFLKSDLSGANLSAADLTGAFLIGASLRNAGLEGAILKGADLYVANLAGARLAGANLEKANLERADLHGADLTRANLRQANLKEADLTEALVGEAQFIGANLSGTKIDKPKTKKGMVYERLTALSNRIFNRYASASDTALYVGTASIASIVGAAFATPFASVSGKYWIIPASFATGVVIGIAGVYAFDRLTDRTARALTRRHSMEETYSEMFYKRDVIHANYLFRQGRYDEALEAFKEIFTKAPDRAEPRFKIARIYQKLNEPDKAEKAYQDLIEILGESLGEDNMYIMESRRALKKLAG